MQRVIVAASAAALLIPALAVAQEQPQVLETQGQAQPQVAQECLDELERLSQRMDEDGYWLSGYRYGPGYGYGVYGYGPGIGGPAAAPPIDPGRPAQPVAPDPNVTDRTDGPWGAATWASAPGTEIQTLTSAAYVLAARGNEQACEAVLAAAATAYGNYVSDLEEAGIDPQGVIGWRQQQILAAQPLDELIRRGVRADSLMGVEVRNTQDRYLGSVGDMIFNPENGEIAYLTIERGGFLGIGSESVPIPWDTLSATPGLNTLVVNIDEAALENAPSLDNDTWGDPDMFESWSAETDQFWEQNRI